MTQLITITAATSNPGKLREIRHVLAETPVRVAALSDFAPVAPPVEDGATFADNARLKARCYAAATGSWCLADDSGLAVDALDGAPGVHSARYADEQWPEGTDRAVIDRANNERLLRELADVPDEQRTARFVCHLALADADRILIETFATFEGRIGREGRGENGFGYDPLFFVPELNQTVAELTAEEKSLRSHRGKALRHFLGLLESLLASRAVSER